ncbi:type II toxin-antitoxin system RelE/ParE family toxin [Chryseobacterium sp. JUb7]|uniref:type II toxin-antitoxin system RelE/ParE family toxin n=1 Tax=Chryseobacterium sp. JUb7 TaxID=2940599 RepID=UPI0021697B06|nr:type II toxin-antitoxin system RelE/ParE family toxin [Chryseobacterium sp. JUb7]MCS3531958.1 plasmid stabilization system protein ParE [Chryseobacterium sp. JUb7]
MVFKIIISAEAKIDIEHSYLYYLTKVNTKTANNFFKDFNSCVNTISKNPYFKIWFEDFHAKPMKKYPFLIFYNINKEKKIVVIARVFHTSQNPKKYDAIYW